MRSVVPRLALTLSLILAGCSSELEAPRGATGAAAQDYFPLVVGARWVYALHGMVSGEVEVVARGPRAVRGLDAEVFVMDELTDGRAVGFADVAPVGYVRLEQHLGRYLGLDYDEDELRLLGGEDPMRFMPLDPQQVTQWEEENRIFELPDGKGGELRWVHRASAVPSLQVPAGVFQDVLRVESQYWDDSVPDHPVLRFEDFYAKGVGLLRTVTYDEQNGGKVTIEQELIRYTFPNES